jgi:hypothetical protein
MIPLARRYLEFEGFPVTKWIRAGPGNYLCEWRNEDYCLNGGFLSMKASIFAHVVL